MAAGSLMTDDRSFLIFYHAATLTQSRVFLTRGQRGFSFTLLEWAGNARRRLAALGHSPIQKDFFA